MAKKRGLGRGLAALIPQAYQETTEKTQAQEITENEKLEKESAAGVKKSTKMQEKSGKEVSVATSLKNNKKPAAKRTTSKVGRTKQKSTEDKNFQDLKPSQSPSDEERFAINTLSLDQMEADPNQPRKQFDEEALADLTESVRRYGVLQPLIVKKHTAPGHAPYMIIAGERRYRAAKLAGLTEVPVVLRQDHSEEAALLSVVENVQREDLSPLEEAVAYQHIMQNRLMTQQELADALGKSRAYIANSVRLMKLDDESLEALRKGLITSSQARTLLSETNPALRAKYRQMFTQGQGTVNKVEKKIGRKQKKRVNVFLNDLEDRLSEHLGTDVSIVSKRKGWSLSISCYSEEELNKLSKLLMEGEEE
ncbi:MAG: ParB/RepB/Spo0J family partition protein [Peptoniphilaceae bacterium]|nr:ParB/RepB/Spo0J family partition protein [Peptoniphilaceae bacterium]MDY3987669.1 ParB/RepB/Spo0J family partition protein [Peptoniphilaceae bacterium]MDY4196109.1 ParB/RepB/Spo0J family partition protein [Peptoniphilaceae bacterium]